MQIQYDQRTDNWKIFESYIDEDFASWRGTEEELKCDSVCNRLRSQGEMHLSYS